MMRTIAGPILLLAAITCVGGAWAELTILDRPMWLFSGEPFRIALAQPAGSGVPEVDVPESVEMYDQWDQDDRQRFYFRALEPAEITLHFAGAGGEVDVPIEIVPWSSLYEPREYRGVQLPRIWPVDDPGYSELKTARTLHTDAEIEALRTSGADAGGIAKSWLEMSDEEVFAIIPGPAIPRTCLMVLGVEPDRGRGKGCPVCGTDIYEGRSGFYPWKFDPVNHPWKVICPNCNTVFPSNDWQSGDMHSGDFPDDGFGCEPAEAVISGDGRPWRWPFIAYYHQTQAYMRVLTPGITQSAQAFMTTGDEGYAHKCLVALFRFAEAHLDMSVNLRHRKRANRDGVYNGPVGAPIDKLIGRLPGSFSYIQPNWDTPRMEQAARAWDLVFDQVEGDEELLSFCRANYHPEIQTAEDFRRFVDAGVLRTAIQYGMDKAVSRNWPMQEGMIATVAVGLGTPGTIDVADYLLNGDGALRYALSNEYFRDGAGHESGGYNSIQINHMAGIVGTMSRMQALLPDTFKPPRFISLADDPKFRQMYDWPIENTLIGRSNPAAGDTGFSSGTNPLALGQAYPLKPAHYVDIFTRTLDPRYAQVIWSPARSLPDTLTDPELRARVQAIGEEQGWQVRMPSRLVDGFGHAILRSGEGDRQRALWMRYGRTIQHRHQDLLTFGFEALGRKMLPELGYPVGWTYAGNWEANWGTHYGTHITGIAQDTFGRGSVKIVCDAAPARVSRAVCVAMSGEEPRARRERVIALIDIDEADCYAITLERVFGGEEHTWSYHGPTGEATIEGVDLTAQGGGTVAGPDVAYRDVKTAAEVTGEGVLSCLGLMPDPSLGEVAGPWSMDVALRDQDAVHLRTTTLTPDSGELATSMCVAPGGKSHYEAMWTVMRRSGEAPLVSEFLNVIEPYEGQRRVQSVELLEVTADGDSPFHPYAIRVRGEGFVDTIIIQPKGGYSCSTPRGMTTDAEFGFWRERNGTMASAVIASGTQLMSTGDEGIILSRPAYHGVIESCDWGKRTIRMMLAEDSAGGGQSVDVVLNAGAESAQAEIAFVGITAGEASGLVGRYVHISGPPTPPAEAGQDVSYLIEAAQPIEGGVELTLRLDPRIGEGPVASCEDGKVISGVGMRMARWLYYAGKHLSNEDASVVYRLADVFRTECRLDSGDGPVTAAQLAEEFGDRDGDGLQRFVIYDYGPGDTLTIPCWASINSAAQE